MSEPSTALPAADSVGAAENPAPRRGLLDRFIDRLDRFTQFLERRIGLVLTSVVVALLLLAAASIYVTPSLQAVNHGLYYEELSKHPFDLHRMEEFGRRIVTPMLAYYYGLRGERYIVFPVLVMWAWLAAIYGCFRRAGFTGAAATGMAALMGFSTPVLCQLHFAGYVDPTTYLLLFLTLIWSHRPVRWAICYGLAVLNHECSLFAAPIVFWAAARSGNANAIIRAAVLLAFSVVPYFLYADSLARQGLGGLSASDYLSTANLLQSLRVTYRCLPLGVLMAFKLFWLLPLAAVWGLWRRGGRGKACWIAAAAIVPLLQILIATDTSRLMGMSFPAILVGAAVARDLWGPERFGRRIWVLIAVNLLVPQYYVGQENVIPLVPLPISLLR